MTVTDELVVLLDPHGDPIGEQRKASVHSSRTPLHLAFSLYLFDDRGRLLMTRRALTKVAWPGVWTNSCCGHPMPREDMHEAIRRRVRAELNLDVTDLRCVLPNFAYRAEDASGIVENERCPVFVGTVMCAGPADDVAPNPDEVMDRAWADPIATIASIAAAPFAFSPWCVEQISLLPQLAARREAAGLRTSC